MNKKLKRILSTFLSALLIFGSTAYAGTPAQTFSDFPESYRPYLTALKEKYPNWNFVPDFIDIDFNEAVLNESKSSLSLVENSSPASWKSSKEEDFDFEKNDWKIYDGDAWAAASSEIVAYYMDPRNFLPVSDTAETKSNFQFLDFSYDSKKQTREGLVKMLKGTFLEGEVIIAEGSDMKLLSAAVSAENKKAADTLKATPSEAVRKATSSEAVRKATPSEAAQTEILSVTKKTAVTALAAVNEISGCEEDDFFERFLNAANAAEIMAVMAEESYAGETDGEENAEEMLLLSVSSEKSYADIIMEAAEESGISPYVLAAFIIQEQGPGGNSDLISGCQEDYPGYYNYFNVGAYNDGRMNSIRRGLWWAKGQDNGSVSYGRPWDTPEKAIINGAIYISEGYLKKGQNTIYYKRFNVGPERKTTLYLHQYMTNVQGAWAEGWLLGRSCEDNGILGNEYTFHIPVYKNMPEKAAPKPEGDLNPNNRLKELSVKGFQLTPEFNMNTYEYTVTADPSVSEVTIAASAAAKTSKVSGTGNIKLGNGKSSAVITVTAENGSQKVYTVNIIGGKSRDSASAGTSAGTSGGTSGGSSGKSSGGSSGRSSGGGGGGGAGASLKKTSAAQSGSTFSKYWYSDANGVWRIKNGRNETIKSAWLCDDAVSGNGRDVWYLLNEDGSMLAAGLVRDNTGNFYSLETEHNGYYGMLRYRDGTYSCNGVSVYIEFSRSHDGTFGAVKNREAIDKLTSLYGITDYRIGNESCVYTGNF